MAEKIKDLDKEKPELFRLGCCIGGEIVVKTLFGENFFQLKFGNNNPYEEIMGLSSDLFAHTRNWQYALRTTIFGRVQSGSRFLSASQKKVLARLMTFKETCMDFLLKEKQRYISKSGNVAPFLQAYFDLKDDSYFDEVVQQLFLFLLAGEDTTGSLIEMCLAMLSIHPQYQLKVLEDVKANGMHNSKVLSNFISETNRLTAPVKNSSVRRVE